MTDGLKMSHVSHLFGENRVLRDISFDVAPGELVCLLGPSGCGKTTALRLAAGLEKLQVGAISVDDQIVAQPGGYVEPEKRGVGMVFQDYALFPHLNVAKNIGFGLRHFSEADRMSAIKAALEQVGMSEYLNAIRTSFLVVSSSVLPWRERLRRSRELCCLMNRFPVLMSHDARICAIPPCTFLRMPGSPL